MSFAVLNSLRLFCPVFNSLIFSFYPFIFAFFGLLFDLSSPYVCTAVGFLHLLSWKPEFSFGHLTLKFLLISADLSYLCLCLYPSTSLATSLYIFLILHHISTPNSSWLLWHQGLWCSILNWWCFTTVLHNIIVWWPFHLFWASHLRSGRCGPSVTWQELRSWSTTDSNTQVHHRCSCSFFEWTIHSFTDNWLHPSRFQDSVHLTSLKTVNLDSSDVRSYRPIANLSVLSKLLEVLVAHQILPHLNSHGLLPKFQSAYRAHHSMETAVLKVLTEILLACSQPRRFACPCSAGPIGGLPYSRSWY